MMKTENDASNKPGYSRRGVKKSATCLNVRLAEDINALLNHHCDVTGQSKTVAVERALLAYCHSDDDCQL